MASVLITTADAVVAELNDPTDHTWSQSFTAERNFGDWKLPLEGAEDKVYVDVFPLVAMPVARESRASLAYQPTIAIVVRYKFRQGDTDEDTGRSLEEVTEDLIELVEEINEHFATPHLLSTSHWIAAEIIPWTPEHMTNPRQFTGMVRATFSVSKDL